MTRKSSVYFLAFAFVPLLLTLQAPERIEFLHQISLTLVKPFLLAGRTLSSSIQKTGEAAVRLQNLYQNQIGLEGRLEELERQMIEKTELERENERLRKLLEFKREIPRKAIPAQVIGRDLVPWRRTILIDKGFRDGIEKRMAVVNAEGLVGRVVEAGPASARAILLVDSESRVGVLFQESRDLGVAEGDGSSWLRVTRIDREASIQVGDLLLSSGLGGIYPKGIPVGRVELVGHEKESRELFASVRPFVDFSKLEEVLCLALSRAGS